MNEQVARARAAFDARFDLGELRRRKVGLVLVGCLAAAVLLLGSTWGTGSTSTVTTSCDSVFSGCNGTGYGSETVTATYGGATGYDSWFWLPLLGLMVAGIATVAHRSGTPALPFGALLPRISVGGLWVLTGILWIEAIAAYNYRTSSAGYAMSVAGDGLFYWMPVLLVFSLALRRAHRPDGTAGPAGSAGTTRATG